ncbi:tetratricopeptide repeat protein [Aggregicoccus sp. 17bor-14]|uniref:tetratricopeptide repeat protein n=1 Tax=Myxococcaceae TaxID=31 RepID=UPI00351A3CCD
MLTACATNAASRSELQQLQAELRVARAENARLAQRLERLELRDTVGRARASTASPPAGPPSGPAAAGGDAVASVPGAPPELAVVKLKPKLQPAPPLPTAVPVVEPAAEQMEMLISEAEAVAPAAAADGAAPAAGRAALPPDARDPDVLEAEYEQAVAALRTGNVEGGVARLERFADENPRHPRADNALYFRGLGLMGLQEFPEAAQAFEALLKRYPAGDAVQDGMLRLAECQLRLKKSTEARELYNRLLTQYPGTAAASQAEQRLASLPR